RLLLLLNAGGPRRRLRIELVRVRRRSVQGEQDAAGGPVRRAGGEDARPLSVRTRPDVHPSVGGPEERRRDLRYVEDRTEGLRLAPARGGGRHDPDLALVLGGISCQRCPEVGWCRIVP